MFGTALIHSFKSTTTRLGLRGSLNSVRLYNFQSAAARAIHSSSRLQEYVVPERPDMTDQKPKSFAPQTQNKRPHKIRKKQKKKSSALGTEGSSAEVLLADVQALLAASQQRLNGSDDEDDGSAKAPYRPPERFSEIEVTVSKLSSTGDGLALSKGANHVYVVPFTVPGDTVRARLNAYNEAGSYTQTDFIEVIKASSMRDDSLVKCPYFSRCSGCQFQMMPYEEQLAHKKMVIENAYRNFSNLTPEAVPAVDTVIGSPLQYGYRTKLTPHFDNPRGHQRGTQFKEVPPIGFQNKGKPFTIDIEDCPIGTEAVREGLWSERKRVAEEIHRYRKGATLLLRESTTRNPLPPSDSENRVEPTTNGETSQSDEQHPTSSQDGDTSRAEDDPLSSRTPLNPRPPYTETKTCITDNNGTSVEYVDEYIFTNPAGSFFQNNNSILPRFTAYIRDHILGDPLSTTSSSPANMTKKPPITNLLDAYSGSGLFTITLSTLFKKSIGIDIEAKSIACATRNAQLNNLSNARFLAATASDIFKDASKECPADETAVVVDPPRKGCDEEFLSQLLVYGPRRVVYVSCNVHTQARDVGVLVEGRLVVKNREDKDKDNNAEPSSAKKKKRTRYAIESLVGFDFFPQTGHVEGVAVLERIDDDFDDATEDRSEREKSK